MLWLVAAGLLGRVLPPPDRSGPDEGLDASLLTAAPTTSIYGASALTCLGSGVAGAGDVDADGYDDVIVGAPWLPYAYVSGVGTAAVYLGSGAGVSSTPATSLADADVETWYGASVAGAGDVDGDGYADVIIGAPWASGYVGRADVHLGSATGTSPVAAANLNGDATANAVFGESVAGVGDLDDDGFDDVAVSASGVAPAGATFVYYGGMTGLGAGVSTLGTESGAAFGSPLAGAGDVDGDGYDDLLVAARLSSARLTDAGEVYLYQGDSAGVASSPDTTLDGEAAYDAFGTSVAGAGDVDGDGYDDVLVGASLADFAGTSSGSAYVFHGTATGLETTSRVRIDGEAGDTLGAAVAGVGDVDGDGHDDIAVGVPSDGTAGTNAGAVWIFLGGTSGTATTPALTLLGTAAGDYFGEHLAPADDVNHDGLSDLIVGVPDDATVGIAAGAAFVFDGSRLASTSDTGGADTGTLGDSAATGDSTPAPDSAGSETAVDTAVVDSTSGESGETGTAIESGVRTETGASESGDTAVASDTGDTAVAADTGDTAVASESGDTPVASETGDTGTGDRPDASEAAACGCTEGPGFGSALVLVVLIGVLRGTPPPPPTRLRRLGRP